MVLLFLDFLNIFLTFPGDWRGQLEHIYAHLINNAKLDLGYRQIIGAPQMGHVSVI